MKNFTTVVMALGAIFLLTNNANGQAFQKGNINLDVGIGFGIYGTNQTATTTYETGSPNFDEITVTTDESDGAVATVIPIRVEYGVMDKLGIGAEFVYNNYLINDSDRVNLNTVKCLDYGLIFNFHLLNAEKNDLFIGLGVGMSSMKINYVTDITQFVESVSGSGLYYSFGITDRIFFSDNIGMMVNLSYKGYNYSSLEADFTPELDALLALSNVTYSQNWDWSFTGVNIGIGLAVKF